MAVAVGDMKAAWRTIGPFKTTLQRVPDKGGWTYVSIPKKLAPPITRALGPHAGDGFCGRPGVDDERVSLQGRQRVPACAEARSW